MNGQSKVVILDSVQSKIIIKQLVQGDVARAENKIYLQMDIVSQERIKELKIGNDNLLKAFKEKQLETDKYKDAVLKQEKIIKRERNKTKIVVIGAVLGIITLLI